MNVYIVYSINPDGTDFEIKFVNLDEERAKRYCCEMNEVCIKGREYYFQQWEVEQ